LLAKPEVVCEDIESFLFQVSFITFNEIDKISPNVIFSSNPLDSLAGKLSNSISHLKHLDSLESIRYSNNREIFIDFGLFF
jgi:hypothetical protein